MTLSATVRQWFSHLSLTTQLVLLAVLPAVLATLAVSMVATRQYLGSVEALIRANAQTAAYQIATAAEEPMRAMDRRALLGIARAGISQPQVKQVRVWSADGELLAQAVAHWRCVDVRTRAAIAAPQQFLHAMRANE